MSAADETTEGTGGRPRVLINMAASLDGRTNPSVRRGPFAMSRHGVDPARMRALRARADAVVIGAGNLRADDPDLGPDLGPGPGFDLGLVPGLGRDAHAAGGNAPLRVLVTTRGEGVRGDEALFDPTQGGPSLVAHAASMPEETRARLRSRATLLSLGETEVDVARLLGALAERGCGVVLVEGGGALNARFFEARAVDELFLTVVPRILGGPSPMVVAGRGFGADEIPDATLVSAEPVGDELFLRYAFRWPKLTARPAAPPR